MRKALALCALAALFVACGEKPSIEFVSAGAEVQKRDDGGLLIPIQTEIEAVGVLLPLGVEVDILPALDAEDEKRVCVVFSLREVRFMPAGLAHNDSPECVALHKPPRMETTPLRMTAPEAPAPEAPEADTPTEAPETPSEAAEPESPTADTPETTDEHTGDSEPVSEGGDSPEPEGGEGE